MSHADHTGRDLDRDVAGAAGAHQRFLASLDSLATPDALGADPETARWVAALLAALVDQAEHQMARFDGAHPEPEYSPRSAATVAEFRRSVWSLEQVWSGATEWDTARAESVFVRWRTIEMAHLALADAVATVPYGLDRLPGDYVRVELRRCEMLWRARRPMGMGVLDPAVLALEPAVRLGWFIGMIDLDGVTPAALDLGLPGMIGAGLSRERPHR